MPRLWSILYTFSFNLSFCQFAFNLLGVQNSIEEEFAHGSHVVNPVVQDLLKPHLMDSMHIEANVAKNLLHTIMGMATKDGRAVRRNCEAFGVHQETWCIPGDEELPPAPWILTSDERATFMSRLATMVFPTRYGAGFEYSFGADWPRGLKSHDYHCLIRHGFPTAIRGLLTPLVRSAIYALCNVFT